MAKSRINRRGKIRSLTRKPNPVVRHYWRKGKTLAMIANRKQYAGEFLPQYTNEIEIMSGTSNIITEASTDANMIYIELE